MIDLRNPIQTPCSQRWEELEGDELQRFCQLCQRPVQNLSALTASEAARLLEAEPELCRMVVLDARGAPLYQPEPVVRPSGPLDVLRRAAVAGMAAPILALSACGDAPLEEKPIQLQTDGARLVTPVEEPTAPDAAEAQRDEPGSAPTPGRERPGAASAQHPGERLELLLGR